MLQIEEVQIGKKTLIFVRHGESKWNKEKRFTGWSDINLTEKGRQQARDAALELLRQQLKIDFAFVSDLKRTRQTFDIIAETLGYKIPRYITPLLRERNYGFLNGLLKADYQERYPENYRRLRTPDQPIPDDPTYETYVDTQVRTSSFEKHILAKAFEMYDTILIVGHKNSILAQLANAGIISLKDIGKINIPNAKPMIFSYDNGNLLRLNA